MRTNDIKSRPPLGPARVEASRPATPNERAGSTRGQGASVVISLGASRDLPSAAEVNRAMQSSLAQIKADIEGGSYKPDLDNLVNRLLEEGEVLPGAE